MLDILVLTTLIVFHEDDPKLIDRQPPVQAAAFRRDDGLRGEPTFPAQGVTLMSWLPLNLFQGNPSSGNDFLGYTSITGREYALMGLSNGTAFVEISDPGNAQIRAFIAGPTSLWRDIKTYGDHAYAVSEGGNGIQVFDLSQIDQGQVSLSGTINDFGTANTHNLAIDTASGFLYRCGGTGFGFRIYDLSDPAQPTLAANWTDRYVHDAQILTFSTGPYAGRQIAFACAGLNSGFALPGLTILDVTDKQNMTELTHFRYSTPAYSHQGWLSPDGTSFYLNDELDETSFGTTTTTRILNVSNLSQPTEQGTFTNNNSAIDHNLYTREDLIFAANYRSGLRVYRVGKQNAMQEVAFFDTYPNDDDAHYNGLWSSYPYFESGTVIGSDLERGLFVWRLDVVPLVGDLNGDLKVDQDDLMIGVERWASCSSECVGDLNADGSVAIDDLATIVNAM